MHPQESLESRGTGNIVCVVDCSLTASACQGQPTATRVNHVKVSRSELNHEPPSLHSVYTTSIITMSRGTRFLTLAIPLIAIYLLALIGFLPVPFLSEETVNQILPVVSLPPFFRYLSHVID
jgi:hypothetical protein